MKGIYIWKERKRKRKKVEELNGEIRKQGRNKEKIRKQGRIKRK